MSRQRKPRERDPKFLGWVAGLPCIACMVHGVYNRAVQVAHLRMSSIEHDKRSTGMQEKPADRWVTPLCMPHHTGDDSTRWRSQHSMSEEAFWEGLGIDVFQFIKALWAAYATGSSGSGVVAQYAAAGRRKIEGAPHA